MSTKHPAGNGFSDTLCLFNQYYRTLAGLEVLLHHITKMVECILRYSSCCSQENAVVDASLPRWPKSSETLRLMASFACCIDSALATPRRIQRQGREMKQYMGCPGLPDYGILNSVLIGLALVLGFSEPTNSSQGPMLSSGTEGHSAMCKTENIEKSRRLVYHRQSQLYPKSGRGLSTQPILLTREAPRSLPNVSSYSR